MIGNFIGRTFGNLGSSGRYNELWDRRSASSLESRVHSVDPGLDFVRYLGAGAFSDVVEVGRDGETFALKMQHSVFSKCSRPISYEYGILCDLSGIRGIPAPHRLYGNAVLMEYVEGVNMRGLKQGNSFFRKLRDIVENMHERGYSLQNDLAGNILVDNEGDPWLIDFMFANKMCSNTRLRLIKEDFELLRNMERVYRK